jgi:two-component system phosphate regulon sensor histidine kinase PhoR
MNKKKVFFIILFSVLSMSGIIWLQIKWIKNGEALTKEGFDKNVEISLWWISEQLDQELAKSEIDLMAESDTAIMRHMLTCKADSLLALPFLWFNMRGMDYSLKVLPNTNAAVTFSYAGNVYRCSAAKQLKNKGLEIRLTFRDKNQYAISELQCLLVYSGILIFFVLGCFILTVRTLWQQKQIFEKTTDFISNMTHEFKTPITNVGFASNLLNKMHAVSTSNRASKLNSIIRQENNKLQHHVEQILNLARLEKGELPLNKIIFNIHDALLECIEGMQLQIKSRDGVISSLLLAETQLISGDKHHIINTFTNLIDNANKYSIDKPEVFVKTVNMGNTIKVSVEDKGIGMDRDKQKLVFDKFYRVPTGNVHNVKGFGLGLSYAKMVVEAHNGNISLKSEQGKGSCFEIFLPLAS